MGLNYYCQIFVRSLTVIDIQDTEIVSAAKNLGYIDLLRGMAILMVIIIHTSLTVNGLSPFVSYVAQYGQMGVQLFFLASAYTLCCSHVRRIGEQNSWRSFFIRRFFRIAPLYYLGIIGYFLLEPYVHILNIIKLPDAQYNFVNIFANILFVHGFVMSANNNIVPGGWSIGTEMAFYLLFPALFSLCIWVDKFWGILGLYSLVGFSIFLNLIIQSILAKVFSISISNSSFVYFNLINQLPVFLLGTLVFFHHHRGVRIQLSIRTQSTLLAVITIAVILLLQIGQSWVFKIIPTCTGISFVFLLNVLKELKYSNVFLEKIGRVSYSMYIVHFMFVWWLIPGIMSLVKKGVLPELLLICSLGLAVGLSYSIATISQKYIETPGVKLGKLLISRL